MEKDEAMRRVRDGDRRFGISTQIRCCQREQRAKKGKRILIASLRSRRYRARHPVVPDMQQQLYSLG